jgi:hypothetical protein
MAIATKITTKLKNLFVAISTNVRGNIDENAALFKKNHENNGNVEKFRGIIRPYVVVHKLTEFPEGKGRIDSIQFLYVIDK